MKLLADSFSARETIAGVAGSVARILLHRQEKARASLATRSIPRRVHVPETM